MAHKNLCYLLVLLQCTNLIFSHIEALGFRYDQAISTQTQYNKLDTGQSIEAGQVIGSQPQLDFRVKPHQRSLPYRLHPDRFRVGTNGCLIRVFLQRKVTPAKNHFNAPQIDYYGVIGIGKPMEFLFNVLFDTTSRETWVPHSGFLFDELHYQIGYKCHSINEYCHYVTKYDFDYGQSKPISLRGLIYRDNITLYEDIQKDDVNHLITKEFTFPSIFLAVKDASNDQFKQKPFDGVIGLSPVVSQGSTGLNFLLALQDAYYSKVIANNSTLSPHNSHSSLNPLMFGLWFNPNQQSHHGGEITFGGYDQSKVGSEFRYHKLSSYTDWQLKLETVRLGSVTISCDSGCNLLLDTTTNSLHGPEQDVAKIHSALGSYREPISGLYIVDCSNIENLPKLQFVIEYTPYELDSAHYVKLFRYKEMIICHADIKPSKELHWRVGTAFIGAYYSVFDMAERRIGFATSRAYA